MTNFYAMMGSAPEVTGAFNVMAGALLEEGATIDQLRVALRACRTVKYPVRLPHILENLPGRGVNDGRPGAEEAWAMCPQSEEASVVWTSEVAAAYSVASPLIQQGDLIAARMAFKEAYTAEVQRARSARRLIKWEASLGFDKSDRVRALTEAVNLGRIDRDRALALGEIYGLRTEVQFHLTAGSVPQLVGEVKKEVKLEVPGLPGVLKLLADTHAMPADINLPKKVPRRSEHEQIAHIRQLKASGSISEADAKKLAHTIRRTRRGNK